MAERRPRRDGGRRDEILRALVEEHIRTGEPVSSRAILDVTSLGVSAATVRNELAALEREGYAVQPHTSAGRVPTARAYRYYVDNIAPSDLPRSRHRRVDQFYSSVQLELGRLLKATTELLSEITHYPAVAVTSGPTVDVVRAVHLVQLGATSALLVVVTASGRVHQDVCRFPEPVSPAEIEAAEETLSRMAVGATPDAVGRDLDDELPPVVESIVAVAAEALSRTAARGADIYVGGTGQMVSVWTNLSALHRVLEVLEREAMLLELLAADPGMAVRLGEELLVPDVDLAVVSSSFEAGQAEGRVGVIGPMRMDYRKVMAAVDEISRELGDRLGS